MCSLVLVSLICQKEWCNPQCLIFKDVSVCTIKMDRFCYVLVPFLCCLKKYLLMVRTLLCQYKLLVFPM